VAKRVDCIGDINKINQALILANQQNRAIYSAERYRAIDLSTDDGIENDF
jgi:hypothetical protein